MEIQLQGQGLGKDVCHGEPGAEQAVLAAVVFEGVQGRGRRAGTPARQRARQRRS